MLGELRALVEREVPGAIAALALAERHPTLSVRARGDLGVLEAARRYRAWVLTADRELADRARSRGFGLLFPRGRSALGATPPRRTDVGTKLG